MTIELAILGGFSNAVRGGQWREWVGATEIDPKTKKYKKYNWVSSDGLNAVIFFFAVLVATGNAYVALVSAPLMWVGASPGWGDYIGALGGWRHSDLKENRFIDPLISHLKFSPKLWGAAGLFWRGLFWGVCLSLPFFYIGDIVTAVGFISCGALMPVAYWLAIEWSWHRAKASWQGAGWALGEIFFGLLLWSNL